MALSESWLHFHFLFLSFYGLAKRICSGKLPSTRKTRNGQAKERPQVLEKCYRARLLNHL